jgi:hypothetical protein
VQKELDETAPSLVDISKTMPYSIPAGYFTELPALLAAKAGREAVVVPMLTRVTKVLRYAAVIVVLLAAFTVYRLANRQEVEPSVTAVATSNPVVANNADSLGENLATQLSVLDDESLDASLSDIGVSSEGRSALYYLNTTNFEAALKEFSTDELSNDLQVQVSEKTNI